MGGGKAGGHHFVFVTFDVHRVQTAFFSRAVVPFFVSSNFPALPHLRSVPQVSTGRCLKTWGLGEAVAHISWNPNKLHAVVAVAAGSAVFLVATVRPLV